MYQNEGKSSSVHFGAQKQWMMMGQRAFGADSNLCVVELSSTTGFDADRGPCTGDWRETTAHLERRHLVSTATTPLSLFDPLSLFLVSRTEVRRPTTAKILRALRCWRALRIWQLDTLFWKLKKHSLLYRCSEERRSCRNLQSTSYL